MAYAAVADIRLHTNLDTTDISDADVTSLIADVNAIINGDINVEVVRERILPIDNTRKNEINGSNTVYYVRHSKLSLVRIYSRNSWLSFSSV